MKWLFRAFLLVTLLALAAGGIGYYYFGKLTMPARFGESKPVIFQVKEGMLGVDVARALFEKGLIADEMTFRLLLRFHPKGRDLRVGYFALDATDTPLEIYDHLLSDAPLSRKATFPEGLVIPEVSAIAKKARLIKDQARFEKLARTDGKSFGDIFPANLEGYLLPDTYEFPYDCDEEKVLQRFTGEFRERVLPLWQKHKPKSYLKSLHEVVVLASLVEREAQVPRERPVIAGVYINRLKIGQLLQCDATVQFALGKQKPVLLYSDLEIESPYNTYKYPGLPPGAIANPGLSSLEAAMAPTPSSYYYYVRDDIAGDGSHRFGKTEAEHNANCAKYQR